MSQDSPSAQDLGSKRLRSLNRRQTLALIGAGSTGVVAGCLGDDDDDEPTDDDDGVAPGDDDTDDDDDATPDPDSPLVRNEFVTTELAAQEDIQFNQFNLTLSPTWGWPEAFPQLVVDSRTHGEFYPVALESYSIDGDTMTAEVQDALTWHNGEQVTADDVVRGFRMADLAGENTQNYFEDIREDVYAEDDTTVVFELDDVYNPAPLITNTLNLVHMFAHEEHYGDLEDRYMDATSDEEMDQISADLVEMNVRADELEPYACGPFELDDIDTQGVHWVKYDDYPWAEIQQNLEDNYDLDLSRFPDELNYERQFTRFFGERPALHQAAIQGQIDGGDGFEIDSREELENEYPPESEINPIVSGWTDAFVFNWRNGEHADMWRDARVRKAFAHILNFEGISGQYHGDWGVVDREFNGMSPPMEGWVDDDWNDQLTYYGQDWDRAEELLLDAGLTQEDGEWYKPNGELFEAEWSAPSNVQWQVDGMQYAASNLSEFGIESNVNVIEGTTYFGQTLPNLDYELARGFIGFSDIVTGWNLTWIRYDAEDENDEPFSHYLQEPYGEPGLEVPPVGEPDSNQTITVNPLELHDELSRTVDEDRIQEISELLSWTFNQTVPKLPGGSGTYNWYMTKRWNYPDQFGEDPLAGLMPYMYSLPTIGALSAKTEDEYEF